MLFESLDCFIYLILTLIIVNIVILDIKTSLNIQLSYFIPWEIKYLFRFQSLSSSSPYPTKWGRHSMFFFLFSSITRHHGSLLLFCHPSHRPSILGRPLLECSSTFILITLFVIWLSFLCIICPYQGNLLLLIFSVTGATFKLPLMF
jgi:hypothetical protein